MAYLFSRRGAGCGGTPVRAVEIDCGCGLGRRGRSRRVVCLEGVDGVKDFDWEAFSDSLMWGGLALMLASLLITVVQTAAAKRTGGGPNGGEDGESAPVV